MGFFAFLLFLFVANIVFTMYHERTSSNYPENRKDKK